MSAEKAIQRCVDSINTSGEDESVDIFEYMYKYKALRSMTPEERDAAYDEIASRLGFKR